MGQVFLRPDADQSDGSWLNEASSNTNIFASVDESSTNDSDYIQSSTTLGDKVRLRLSDPGTTVSTPMIVRYRAKRGSGNASAGIIGRLFQGTTQISTWTLAVDDTLTTYTYTLTAPEFASISDFNDLFVEFEYAYIWWLSGAAIDLDFNDGLYYDSGAGGAGQAVTSYLSCSRASTGYAKTVAGALTSFATNTLRITDLGLLVEDARTNYLLQSADLSTTWGTDNTTVTTNQVAAPDGTTTMDKVHDGVASGRHIVYQQVIAAITAGNTVSFSVFVKDLDRRYVQLQFSNGAGTGYIYCYADLQTGTITDSGVGAAIAGTAFTSATIEAFASGTYRITLTGVVDNVEASPYQIMALSDRSTQSSGALANGSPSYTGSTKSVYLWGAQAEIASFPSSYIPTTTVAVTRAADNLTISGSLQTAINAATGSLVAQTDQGAAAGIAANIVDSNATNLLGFNSSNNALASMIGALATANTANRTTQDKLGLAWNASGRSLVLNGGTVATDASAQTPSATQHVGSSGTANFAYAYVERLTAWTTKLADATLQGFTV
jgi:hypothetical protein